MALELLHWLWMLLVTTGAGSLLVRRDINTSLTIGSPTGIGKVGFPFSVLFINSIAGLALLGMLAMALNFFIPVSGWLGLGIGLVCIGIGIWRGAYQALRYPFYGWGRGAKIGFAVASLALLAKAAAPSSFYDMGLYYIQTIRWAERFAVVPGLANLHSRLGFNSSWHGLTALLNPLGAYYTLDGVNEYLLLLTIGFFVFGRLGNTQASAFTAGQLALGWGVAVVTPLYLVGFITAPAADLAVICLAWVKGDFSVAESARPAHPGLGHSNILKDRRFAFTLLIAAFAITVKLSALPIVLSLVLVSIARKEMPKLAIWGWVLVGIAGLWALRTWVLTGYPLFPFPTAVPQQISPGWQVPMAEVQKAADDIKGFARLHLDTEALAAKYTYHQLANMRWSEWLPLWWGQKAFKDVVTLCFMGVTLALGAAAAVTRRLSGIGLALYAATLLGVAFWFVTAPSVRFGLSYATVALGIAVQGWVGPREEELYLPSWRIAAGQIGQLIFATTLFIVTLDTRPYRQYALIPAAWPTVHEATAKDGAYLYPDQVYENGSLDQCWDAPLPCGENSFHHIRRRGAQLQDGFEPIKTKN